MSAKMKVPNWDTLLEVARVVQQMNIHLDVFTNQEDHTCGSMVIQISHLLTQRDPYLVDCVKTEANTQNINHIQYNDFKFNENWLEIYLDIK